VFHIKEQRKQEKGSLCPRVHCRSR
jgi:hypothetical protein